MTQLASSRRPSLWIVVPVVMVLIAVWTNTDFPLDYWMHVNNGRWMTEHREWITADTFSHTIEGQPVRNQPWLAQLVMYHLHAMGGYRLNQFLAGLLYAFAVATIVHVAGRRCGNWTLAAALGLVAAIVLSTNLGVRPQCFAVVLFALQLALLMTTGGLMRVGLGNFLILACWTNMHGSFPVGVILPWILMLATGVGSWRYRGTYNVHFLLFAAVFAAAGCMVRPFPTEAVGYVHNVSTRSVERGLTEWLPPDLHSATGMLFFASVVLVIIVLGVSRRRLSLQELLLLTAFFVLGLMSQRMLLWWALILPVAIARPADHVYRRVQDSRFGQRWFRNSTAHAKDRWGAAFVGSLLAGLLLFSTPWSRSVNVLLPPLKRVTQPAAEPLQMASFLAATPQVMNCYAPLPWGAYLSWYSHGRIRSFVDSRVDFFPDEVWDAFVRIRRADSEARRLLDFYGVDLVICSQQDLALRQALEADSQWELRYADEIGQVFVRGASRADDSAIKVRPLQDAGATP